MPKCDKCQFEHIDGCADGFIEHRACPNFFRALNRGQNERLQGWLKMPSRYDDAKLTDCHESIQKWAADGMKTNVMLCGTKGVGKSHTAAAIVHHARKVSRSACFVSAAGLLRLIRSTFGGKHDLDENAIVNMCEECDILVIDDLGKEADSDFSQRVMFDVINERYNAEKPIIVTTNMTSAELKSSDRMEAALSRLTEDALILTLKTKWRKPGEVTGE